MHYRFLVTCDRAVAGTSEEARAYVFTTLQEEGFTGQRRWGGGLADWFVIGGRWSGELSRHSWARGITAGMEALERTHGIQVWGALYADGRKERMQQQLAKTFQRMWDAEAPAAYVGIPYVRDTYKEDGYADDAMVLTRELYDALLKAREGQAESAHHADVAYEPVSPAMVGQKWLVVVDYHT